VRHCVHSQEMQHLTVERS